ncbi:MAG: cupin domain-containing protein [Candidatus Aminicenantia bacterium]
MIIKNFKDEERVRAGEEAEKAFIRWLIGEKEKPPNFYLRLIEIEPGGNSPYHNHNYEHEVFVIEGEGFLVDEEKREYHIKKGDAVYVPPTAKHQFKNKGIETLRFICVIPKQT